MKQLFHIDNPGDSSIPQVLSIRFGQQYVCFSISNKQADQLFRLAYCTSVEWNETELDEFIVAYPVLTNSFYQVLIAYDYTESSLVPIQDYRQEESGNVLRSLYGRGSAAITIAEAVPQSQLYNIFAVPKEIIDWTNRKFPSAKCWHQYTIGIRNSNAAGAAESLFVDFRKEDFTIMAVRQGKLLLAQSYEYVSPEDVLYYLFRITQQFSLSQEECKVCLSGLVDQQSSLYKELYQYFNHHDFREATWNAGNYPAHFFTSLNDLARCAS